MLNECKQENNQQVDVCITSRAKIGHRIPHPMNDNFLFKLNFSNKKKRLIKGPPKY